MEYYKLDNGLTIMVDHRIGGVSTSCVFQFLVGARDQKVKHGLAHFLEHALFSGTKTKTKEEIRKQFQNYGCYFNASTGIFRTKYYIRTINEYFENGFKVLADVISNPLFDNKCIDNERKVIKDEILRNCENQVNYGLEKFRRKIFENTGWSCNVLGEMEDIDKITQEDLIYFYQSYYNPSNLVISFSGNITLDRAKELVELFVHLPNQGSVNRIEMFQLSKDYLQIILNDHVQSTVCIFMQGVGSKHRDAYLCFELLLSILGGTISSRLFLEIRERLGLVYHIQTFRENYIQFSLWGVSFSCKQESVRPVMECVFKIIEEIVMSKPITSDELEFAKKEYKVSLLTGLETSTSRANFFATQFWNHEEGIDIVDKLKKMDAVALIDVQSCAKDMLVNMRKAVLIIGGKHKEEDFDFLFNVE